MRERFLKVLILGYLFLSVGVNMAAVFGTQEDAQLAMVWDTPFFLFIGFATVRYVIYGEKK